MKECFAMLYPFTTELYPTPLRTFGFGWASGIGRLGSFIMPFILFPIFEIKFYYPFFIFISFSIICTVASFTFPYDTSDRPLDHSSLSIELISKKEENK